MSELSRNEEKIEANKYKQQKCDEAIVEAENVIADLLANYRNCLLYTSPSPRDQA